MNNLTFIGYTADRNSCGSKLGLFKCSCGKTSIHTVYRVFNNEIKSCGCLRKSKNIQLSGLKTLFHSYKGNAKGRELTFKLSFKKFVALVSKSCYYCKQKPSLRYKKFEFVSNGIDRVDSSKGYTKNNVVPCCKICNRAKGTLSSKEFLDWIKRLRRQR